MKKLGKIVLSAFFAVMLSIAGLFLTSCGGEKPIISVTASKDSLSIEVGEEKEVSFKVENYKNDGEVVVRVFDEGVSDENSQSQKIRFTTNYEGNGVTSVLVEGNGGGRCVLTATTKEGGNKTAQILIDVREYSSSISPKNEKMFVSSNTDFVPSDKDFTFSDTATEKDLIFYYIENSAEIANTEITFEGIDEEGKFKFSQSNSSYILRGKEFTSCSLDKEHNKLIFTQTSIDLNGNTSKFEKSVYDTEKIYFIAEYENKTKGESYYTIADFTCFFGLDTEKFKILDTESGEEIDLIELVSYTNQDSTITQEIKKEIYVKVPVSSDAELEFDYKIDKDDLGKISVLVTPVSSLDTQVAIYKFAIISKIAYKTTAKIDFSVYYKNYSGINDEIVSVSKSLQIDILVAPNKIKVNDLEKDDARNSYTFYNSNVGEFGWQEFYIAVYAEDSSYSGCRIEFESSKVEIKHGQVNLPNNGEITDLSKPLMIRGANGAALGNGVIKIYLDSRVYKDGVGITYEINYEIIQGARKLSFERPEYEYSINNPDYGVYISSSAEEMIFKGIIADSSFKSATAVSTSNNQCVKVEYYPIEESSFVVPLKLTPLKVGMESFNIYLDNGRMINVTFRVVDTFDEVYISQNQNGENKGVQSVSNNGYGLELILRNSYQKETDSYLYNAVGTLQINSNNGTNVINSISYVYEDVEQKDIIFVEENRKGEFSFRTKSFGRASIRFRVNGICIENFMVSSIDKDLEVMIESFNPTFSFEINKKGTEELANQLILFTTPSGNAINSSSSLDAKLYGFDAFNFYDYSNETYVESKFKKEYIYYTCSETIYNYDTGKEVDKMVFGSVYKIGEKATFDTETMTISALPSQTSSSFVLYAGVKQYGLSKAFAINVEIKQYDAVEYISTNISESEIVFDQTKTEVSFIINLKPLTATNLGLKYFDETNNSTNVIKTPKIEQIRKGVWLVTLSLNPEFNNIQGKNFFEKLTIVPADWVNSHNQIVEGKRGIVYNISYQDGTEDNPYILQTAEDILSIAKDEKTMSAHYKISRTIDMSAYADRLPLVTESGFGIFTGSIIGSNNAKIIGLNVKYGKIIDEKNYYGLFAILGLSTKNENTTILRQRAKIENITFEGTLNIEELVSSNIANYVGLIAGYSEAELINIAVVLKQSNIKIASNKGYIGVAVGFNNGLIEKNYNSNLVSSKDSIYYTCAPMTTALIEDKLDINCANTGEFNIGIIAGKNDGEIKDSGERTLYGYSGYMAYGNINVTGNEGATYYIGGVAGQSSKNISGMLIGGKLSTKLTSSIVGGIVGNASNGKIENITTRTSVRGYNAGAIAGNVSNTTIENIKIEAVDDGISINEEASMVVKYSNTDTVWSGDETKQWSFIAVGSASLDVSTSKITFDTYVSREYKSEAHSTSNLTEYLGDYIIVNTNSEEPNNRIKARKQFNSQNAEAIGNLTAKNGFVELKNTESESSVNGNAEETGNGGQEGSTEGGSASGSIDAKPQMFTAYYFKAESYVNADGEFTTVDLQKNAQDILDRTFNTIPEGSVLRPFDLPNGEYVIKSDSRLVTIDSKNNIIVNGAGVAKLTISSALDGRLNKVVYLYIVNYYNSKMSSEQSFFKNQGIRLSGESKVNVYSHSNTIIDIEPVYFNKLIVGDEEVYINDNREVEIGNKIIKLAENRSIVAGITENSAFKDHVTYDISSENIVLSKKADAETNSETKDGIVLTTKLHAVVDGMTYEYDYDSRLSVNVSYYEGVSEVLSQYDSYLLNTSSVQEDKVILKSDDNSERLHYKIYRDGYYQEVQIDEEGKYVVTGGELFKVDISGNNLNFNIKLSVNKDSNEYKNRFNSDIFGKYTVEFFGSSNQEISKKIVLTLSDRFIDKVVYENYANQNDLISSNRVIPSEKGLLSVTVSPADYDFKEIVIENDEINFMDGASRAVFEVGYLITESGVLGFKPISGAVYSKTGISISRDNLIKGNENFDGQFYIRYVFGDSVNVLDGNSVALNTYIVDRNNEIVDQQRLVYKIYKAFSFDVSISDKLQEDGNYYVARGVSYKLNIENRGYDSDTIEITTSNSSLAVIEKDLNGDYILKINNAVIDYTSGSEFDLIAKASRENAIGEKVSISSSKPCNVLEYVLNMPMKSQENRLYDIIEGLQNGNLVNALGEKGHLSVDLIKYLEYDSTSSAVVEKINEFMDNLTDNGSWQVFLSDNVTQPLPEYMEDIENKNDYQAITITDSSQLETKYFSFSGLEFMMHLEHNPNEVKNYMFTYSAKYKIDTENGVYVLDNSGSKELYSEFSMLSYIRGSEESPNPIADYAGLKKMNTNGHYILTKDIEIAPETFKPINGNFASLDGNGFSVIFKAGTYDISNFTDVGIFSEIESGSVVKNLIIQMSENKSDKVVFETKSKDVTTVGLVTSRNAGSITNAKVFGLNSLDVRYNSEDASPTAGCYVAGIAASNSGNITNSRVSLSISTTVSLGGIAGVNSGIISSSYYKGGTLTNTSSENTKFYTAGLVVNNGEEGKIYTSYSSGDVENNHIYSYDARISKLNSSVQVAGAVYSNSGTIRDCYSSIPINTTSSSAGFVYESSGRVENCFSTSIILNDYKQSNYYFVGENNIIGQVGIFKNCYYLKDKNAEYLNLSGTKVTGINRSLASEIIEGVEELSVADFGDTTKFDSYAYGYSSKNYNNVWMFINNGTSVVDTPFKETIIEKDTVTGKFKSITHIDQSFAGGRLELVSANILSTSIRILDEERTENTEQGTIYFYNYEGNDHGSILNPYLINSADTFEEYMSADGKKIENRSSFRLISNINYQGFERNITTHKVDFQGILEGNGMMITNIEITSGDSAKRAGLLSSISGENSVSGVMNLTIIPKIVNFPNANIVGALAGSVKQANVINVNVYSGSNNTEEEGESVTVSGLNISGGVIGLVSEGCNIKNITSTVGSKSSFVATDNIKDGLTTSIYSPSGDIKAYSYSGGVFGYIYASYGKPVNIDQISVSGRNNYVIGQKTGFVFGGISKNVNVSEVTVNISDEMLVKAYKFGGFVVGETAGTIDDIVVLGSSAQRPVFSVEGYVPMAVGGVAGYMIGGEISNVYMRQSFVINPINSGKTIEYAGGIVGYINDNDLVYPSNLSNIIMDSAISARNVLGGIVGGTESRLIMENIAIYKQNSFECELSVTGELPTSHVGGFVGINNDTVEIKNAYSHANIQLDAYVYNKEITANVSAILAGPKGVNYKLENMYTLTQYAVSLENKSVASNAGEVKSEPNGDDYKLTCGGMELGEKLVFNYTHRSSDDTAVKNVNHFLGTIEGNDYSRILGNTTKFSARLDATSLAVKLNQKEQGRSIAKKLDKAALPQIEDFYAIMRDSNGNNIAGWTVSEDLNSKPNGLPYLEFEKKLRKA